MWYEIALVQGSWALYLLPLFYSVLDLQCTTSTLQEITVIIVKDEHYFASYESKCISETTLPYFQGLNFSQPFWAGALVEHMQPGA